MTDQGHALVRALLNHSMACVTNLTTRREGVGSILANQIDSVEACLARTGTGAGEINDSASRVNPPAPKGPHQFRENGGLSLLYRK